MTILSMKEGLRTIKLISEAGVKLDKRIHDVGVAGVAHFLQHGDTTLISELCHAMPRSSRGNALKFWITKNIRVKWSTKAHNGKGGFVKNGDMDLNNWGKIAVVMAADAAPFYLKEDKEAAAWNPNASILSLVKRLEKFKEEHNLVVEDTTRAALLKAIS
jgi:hypothetical protein